MNSSRIKKVPQNTFEVAKWIPRRCYGFWPLIVFSLAVVIFFWKFFLRGLLPIPADTIVGMYHPWRDIVWDNFAAGVPFKNFLITDPVRQQFPWRKLAMNIVEQGQLPFWNPYTYAGTPLLANFQSAPFYIFNFLFFIFHFSTAWGVLIFLQPLLAGIFLYFYLRHLELKKAACLLGALSFSFSGFFIAWLEWGTILHVGLWLPLVLLSVDKISQHFKLTERLKIMPAETSILDKIGKHQILKTHIKNKKLLLWEIVFVLSLAASFFAGHLQTSFYLILFSLIYLVWRSFQVKKNRGRLLLLYIKYYLLFILIASVQWLPALRFIRLSARGVDQLNWQKTGWFIPWRHLVQFLAPDFFGNPATLNYWGEWNYGEFIGYIGVIPLIFALYAIFWRREIKTLFFGSLALFFLSFSLLTPWAKLPYQLEIPFIATSQPTRFLFLVDFCLATLAALGLDSLLSHSNDTYHWSKKRILIPLLVFGFLYGSLWSLVLLAPRIWPGAAWISNLAVSKRNLILPTGIFFAFVGLQVLPWLIPLRKFVLQDLMVRIRISKIFGSGISRFGFLKDRPYKKITLSAILLLTIFDLLRFGWKFTPLTKKEWLFPETKTIEFLKTDQNVFRLMSTDRRLFPPNFSAVYGLQTVDGYDPLYLRRYGELMAASERGEPNISPPFGFNRIITPQNYQSRIIDLLNVKYILSLTDQNSPKLELVFQEGETKVYENKSVFPRAFMVYDYRVAQNRQETINLLMDVEIDLAKVVILEEEPARANFGNSEKVVKTNENQVKIKNYQSNKIVLEVKTDQPGLVVLTDSYYPGWQAIIDGQETKIYRADYNFRGIITPEGLHEIIFKYGWY